MSAVCVGVAPKYFWLRRIDAKVDLHFVKHPFNFTNLQFDKNLLRSTKYSEVRFWLESISLSPCCLCKRILESADGQRELWLWVSLIQPSTLLIIPIKNHCASNFFYDIFADFPLSKFSTKTPNTSFLVTVIFSLFVLKVIHLHFDFKYTFRKLLLM